MNAVSVIREMHMDVLTNSFWVKPDATIDILLLTVFVEDTTSGFSPLTLSPFT